jgi:hypothetical protein
VLRAFMLYSLRLLKMGIFVVYRYVGEVLELLISSLQMIVFFFVEQAMRNATESKIF